MEKGRDVVIKTEDSGMITGTLDGELSAKRCKLKQQEGDLAIITRQIQDEEKKISTCNNISNETNKYFVANHCYDSGIHPSIH